jgi:hypothetical protein
MRRSRKLSSESVIRPQKNLVASASDSPASTQRMRTSHRRDPSCDRPAIISARVEGSRAATASHSQPQHGPAGYGCRGRSWDRKILERERDVGESQSVLIIINPMISPRTRVYAAGKRAPSRRALERYWMSSVVWSSGMPVESMDANIPT